nr:polyphenol oxidase family protein [Clostridia bacterium]
WRGCALGIAGKTVETMVREYGVSPRDIFSAIGPHICKKCFEIDEPVYLQLKEAYPDEALYTYNPVKNKFFADLGGIVMQSLEKAGVPRDNISLGGVCTCCSENRELFFSYRGEKGKNEGLMGAAIWLR